MYLKEDGDGGDSVVLIWEEREKEESDEFSVPPTSGNITR